MALTDASADALSALIECLEAEYRALLAEDIRHLHAVLVRKQQLLAHLAAQPTATYAPPENGQRATTPLRQRLTHACEINRRNALVLAPRLAGIRARLGFLQAAAGREPMYAADGSLTSGVLRAAYPQSA